LLRHLHHQPVTSNPNDASTHTTASTIRLTSHVRDVPPPHHTTTVTSKPKKSPNHASKRVVWASVQVFFSFFLKFTDTEHTYESSYVCSTDFFSPRRFPQCAYEHSSPQTATPTFLARKRGTHKYHHPTFLTRKREPRVGLQSPPPHPPCSQTRAEGGFTHHHHPTLLT